MSSEIKVDTISENTAANGVSIDGLTIKDGGISATTGAIVFNEASADVDFRVESNGNASMLHVNGGNNLVGIGADPDLGAGLHIKTADTGASVDGNADELVIEGTRSGLSILSANNDFGYILFGDDGSNNIGSIRYGHSANDLRIIVGGNEAMVIDATGAVTMPLQPCFRVGSGTQDNVAVSANVNVIFSNEIFDTNADFNTGTYTFTAPVTGKYQFEVLLRIDNADTAYSYIQMVLGGSNRNTTMDTLSPVSNFMSADGEVSLRGSAILDMDTNDTAIVRIRMQGGTAQADINSDGSYFMGHLIG